MEFRQIQYFVCLHEEGSVTRAANRLNIVQPALSMQIGKLEEELGQQLFHRSTRGMTPTPAGSQMYQLFLPILADFNRARAQLANVDGELTGNARIGLIASVAQDVLADALLEFSAAHPRVTLSITDGFTDTLSQAVADGRLDAAVINQPRRRIALNSQAILDEDVVLVTASSYAPLPAEVSLSEVCKLHLVLPTRQHGLRAILESFAQTEGLDFACALEVDSINAIVQLVERGNLATLLPRIAVRSRLSSGALVAHKVVRPHLVRTLSCVSHPRRPMGPAATAFVALLGRHIRKGLGESAMVIPEEAPVRTALRRASARKDKA